MSKFGMSLFAGLMMVGAMACDDGVADTAENAGICQRICNQVDKCTGNDDSTDCRKECVDKSENDAFEDEAKQCSECVDREDKCSTNVINCATECAGVIAISSST